MGKNTKNCRTTETKVIAHFLFCFVREQQKLLKIEAKG